MLLASLAVVFAVIIVLLACKRPRDPGTPPSGNRGRDVLHLFQHLWSLLLVLAVILATGWGAVPAALVSIAASALVYRFAPRELGVMLKTAFEPKLMANMFLVLVLTQFIDYSGALEALPAALSGLPIPAYLVFCLVFFLGGFVSGQIGIIAIATPLAFAAVPEGGVALMALLMCVCHAASQIQPTHICLAVAADCFNIELGALIRRTVPSAIAFVAFAIAYYNVLTLLA